MFGKETQENQRKVKKMKKLKLCVLTIITILLLQSQVVFAADQEVNIVINGNRVAFTQDSGCPYVDENSRTMVPLRITMESAGCSVGYDVTNQVAIVISEHDRAEVPIGTDYIYNNNEKLQNDTFAVVNNGRTYLPIRIVLESMGYTVGWDSKTKTVNAYNFTINNEFVPYSTSSLETLVEKILNGDVVYIGGQYYTAPEYVKQMTNTVVHYTGDDLNTAIYPQDSRYDFSNDIEYDWISGLKNFGKVMIPASDLDCDTTNLEKGYIDGWVYVYAFFENGLTDNKIIYAVPDMTDDFMSAENVNGTFNGIQFKKENGVLFFNVNDLEQLNLYNK